jgi:hypothetical protein
MFTVRLALRPLRVGLVVKHGDFGALWKAVRYNTCLWGGLHNPIIPVGDGDLDKPKRLMDRPLSSYLPRTFDVDLLHDLSGAEVTGAYVARHEHLKWPLGQELVSDEGTEHEHLTLLDVRPVVHSVTANSPRGPQWAMATLPEDGWRANLMRVSCGDPDGLELGAETLRSACKGLLRVSDPIVRNGGPLPLQLVSALWPIHLSTLGLEQFRPRHAAWSNPGVFLGDADDFDDLVGFWNLRAAGNDVMFLPTQALAEARPLAEAHTERVRGRRFDPGDGPTIWTIRNRHPESVIAEARTMLGEVRVQDIDAGTWNGLNIKPVRAARDWETSMAHLGNTYAESAWLDVQLPPLGFDRSALGRWNRWQHIALDVDAGDFLVGDERLTLKFPQLPRMNAFIDQGHAGMRVKREHLSLFVDAERSVYGLSARSFRAVMREVLAHCGFEMKDSVPGKYSRRALELMGGVQGCRVLKLPGVRKLLRAPATRKGIEWSPACEIISDVDPATKKTSLEQLDLFLDGERATMPEVVLRHLVKKGVLSPGVALECPKCGERTWYATTRLRKRVPCECCGAVSGTEARLGDKLRLQFKVAPLWVKADVQFGVIPVILALWRMEELHSLSPGRFLTSVELSGAGAEMEVDFIGLIEERDERQTVLVGECKSTRERDPDKLLAKIARLRAWYDAVKGAGLDACVAFVTAEREFDQGLLAECEAMVREKRRVLLFTARELDPYMIYGEADDVPRKHPTGLYDLCANGVARYIPALWKERQDALPKTKWTRLKLGDGEDA